MTTTLLFHTRWFFQTLSQTKSKTNNDQPLTTPESAITQQSSNTSRNEVGSLIKVQPDSDHEKAPLPVNATTPKSQSDDQQDMNTTTDEKNESFSKYVTTFDDGKPTSTLNVTTKLQPPDNDDHSDLSSGTNSTSSKTEPLSRETTGLTTEGQSNPVEDILDNQPKHKQKHVAENLNNEISCEKPAPKSSGPEIKPRASTEADKH